MTTAPDTPDRDYALGPSDSNLDARSQEDSSLFSEDRSKDDLKRELERRERDGILIELTGIPT